ncbi:DUF7847 domain-containing protein [Natrarchaeobius chitinivorans]|uniref:DUF7847 domain-containing protein n=1 Tax=Natrarchaeobius chitinivorans TaxID=1679083 RepID=A0A3N6LZC6_NATCH|nr:hypothetical protein [Natrarchaeobius chitinivorans]RQG94537.1 hypothetical protein EA473_10625 [Natrarchaeobius chitinivorans]
MAVLPAFRDGWTVLRENPVILLAGLLFATVSQLGTAVELINPWVAIGVSVVGFLLAPFFLGGIIGMALEALEESATTLGQLAASGKAFYLSLLGASVLFGALMFAIAFGGVLIAFFGIAAGIGLAGAEGGALAVLGVGVGMLLVLGMFLLVFVLFLFLQFYSTAIVVENERAFGSFSRSIDVVRSNLASVVGYSLLWIGISIVVFTPIVGLEFALVEPGLVDGVDQTLAHAITILVAVVVTGLLYSYLYSVHTAYYTRLIPDRVAS